MKRLFKLENIIYMALWAILLIAPVMSAYFRTQTHSEPFEWSEVFMLWRQYLPFLLVFILHNWLLAPLLLRRHRRWLYFSTIVIIIVLFQAYQCVQRPNEPQPRADQRERRAERREPPRDRQRPPFEYDHPADFDHPPMEADHEPPPAPPADDAREPKHRALPPIITGEHDLVSLIILVLMLGMNIGVKLYFKSRRDSVQLQRLARENLEQQLEYLKYQINPHFFMNTLNNIHALVDIDPEQAKATIVELSKLMRFVLYDGARPRVPLQRELDFMLQYVHLMQMRYTTDKVSIEVALPDTVPDVTVPPLLLITFVENAFKHGVSYQRESFVDIEITADNGVLQFRCTNSKVPKGSDQHGGVGLANARKRLDLIYGTNYQLDITDTADTYSVRLTIQT